MVWPWNKPKPAVVAPLGVTPTITPIPQVIEPITTEIHMSFIKDLESFASKFETEIEKLWTKAPSFDSVALTTLTFVGPILETVVEVTEGPAVDAAVTLVINAAERDLIAAKALITAVGPTLSVKSLLAGVSSDLGGLLTAAQVTNPTSASNVKLVVGELNALVNAFPVAAGTASTTAA